MRSSCLATIVAATLSVLAVGCASTAPAPVQRATPASTAHVNGGGLRSGGDAALPPPPAGGAGSGGAAGSGGDGGAAASAGDGEGASGGGGTPEPASPLAPNTVVLHVGDSFLDAGFSQTLRPRMKAVGALYVVRSAQASYTTTWHLNLSKLVGDYHPDLVIINLGANEVTLTDPQARADAVERLVKIVADRPCVWVTPPLWRKDTGIIEVIRKHSAPCRLFDSDARIGPISRQADAIHPDSAGGAAWAEAFWTWLLEQRAPPPAKDEALPRGSGRHAVNPWRLRPEKHAEKNAPDKPDKPDKPAP